MKPTFDSTVNILVQAYLNDTLEHSNCSACAVGNLVAAAFGDKPIRTDERRRRGFSYDRYESGREPKWQNVFVTPCYGEEQDLNPGSYMDIAKDQIDSTGYSWQELALIEKAFESAPQGENELEWMFNGLMEVVDILAEIHGVDLTTKESAKALFVKTPSL